MVNNDLWVGVLLVDASTTPGETLGADIWVVGLKDASNLAAATWGSASEMIKGRERMDEQITMNRDCD